MADPLEGMGNTTRDLLGVFAVGIAGLAGWLWRYMRPGQHSGTVTVTPADVRERVETMRQELKVLIQEMQLFMQEERSIHPQIIGKLETALADIREVAKILNVLALDEAKKR